ncbi:MAG: hypothetical protein SF028_01795 [Candidatus Sumerlaeia bacterium]|nr:hypothetical protein [Candidatus Sumerlaeia bacterium]
MVFALLALQFVAHPTFHRFLFPALMLFQLISAFSDGGRFWRSWGFASRGSIGDGQPKRLRLGDLTKKGLPPDPVLIQLHAAGLTGREVIGRARVESGAIWGGMAGLALSWMMVAMIADFAAPSGGMVGSTIFEFLQVGLAALCPAIQLGMNAGAVRPSKMDCVVAARWQVEAARIAGVEHPVVKATESSIGNWLSKQPDIGAVIDASFSAYISAAAGEPDPFAGWPWWQPLRPRGESEVTGADLPPVGA